MRIVSITLVLIAAVLQSSCGDNGNGGRTPAGDSNGTNTGGTDNNQPMTADCAEAIEALEEAFAETRQCNSDSDCNYVNGPFLDGMLGVVDRDNTTSSVAFADCVTGPAAIRFLVVANGDRAENRRSRLVELSREQQDACTEPGMVRCEALQVTPTNPVPVCSNGTCMRPENNGEQ